MPQRPFSIEVACLLMLLGMLTTPGCGKQAHPAPTLQGNRTEAERLTLQAQNASRQGNLAEEIRLLTQAADADPTWSKPLVALADGHARAANFAAETDALRKALKRSPDDLDIGIRMLRKSSLFSSKDLIAIATRMEARHADNPELQYHLGTLLAGDGSDPSNNLAEKHLRRSLELAPDGIPSLIELGRLLLNLQRPKDALEPLTRAQANLEQAEELFKRGAPLTELESWVQMKRQTAFWMAQSYGKLSLKADAAAATKEAGLRSRQASLIRTLRDRAYANPPDQAAKLLITKLMGTGDLTLLK